MSIKLLPQVPPGYRRGGLGDVIAALAALVGIRQLQHCGCKDRQAWLNRHVPLPFSVRKTGDPVLDGGPEDSSASLSGGAGTEQAAEQGGSAPAHAPEPPEAASTHP